MGDVATDGLRADILRAQALGAHPARELLKVDRVCAPGPRSGVAPAQISVQQLKRPEPACIHGVLVRRLGPAALPAGAHSDGSQRAIAPSAALPTSFAY